MQLQPTDALLCIANLPCAFTQQQFEELVRPFGNLERCFLVYSASTGHSKGYGFVEYMKKDSAARAKSELLGKQLGSRMLYVHWTEVGSLTYPLLHSKCLCVDRLPPSLLTAQDLRNVLIDTHAPVFCQVEIHHTHQCVRFKISEGCFVHIVFYTKNNICDSTLALQLFSPLIGWLVNRKFICNCSVLNMPSILWSQVFKHKNCMLFSILHYRTWIFRLRTFGLTKDI